MLAKRAGGVNRMNHPPLPTDKSRAVVRPSPDQFYSGCVYDLAAGPLVVRGTAPLDSYWSLSFFQHNTDVFFVVNDRQLSRPDYAYVLVREGQAPPPGFAADQVVRSPSRTGIIVQRVFVDSEAHAPELDRIRKTARCDVAGG